jgi:hypothetical protein
METGDGGGGEQALWQGGAVVDRFEARKRSGGGGAHRSCPRRCLRLIWKRRRKHELGVEGAGDWVGELHGVAPELGDGSAGGSGQRCSSTMVARWHSGGRRKEKGSFTGSGSLYSG